jgi:D-serine dehydratase
MDNASNVLLTDFVRSILDLELDAKTKGLPLADGTVRLGDVGQRGWNVLRGDMMLPLLTLSEARMDQNLRLMREYADFHGVSLAPHGKSSVCPQLYLDQMTTGGCWGMTAATVQQAAVVAATGIANIVIANEVVSRANIQQLATLKRRYQQAAIYSLVDSPETVQQLAQLGRNDGSKFQVLLEVGYPGGRTGARTMDRATEVLTAIREHAALIELCGIECYEGTINLPDPVETIAAVDRFLAFPVALLEHCRSESLFRPEGEILLTAGGSSYFDRVVTAFAPVRAQARVRIVLRGGSYLTYDHGFYKKKLQYMDERGGLEGPSGHIDASTGFAPALQLWAMVQSMQDPGTAILTMGIRDLPYDLGYPAVLRQYRDGRQLADFERDPAPVPQIVNANDQHCYLAYPDGADVRVGDVFACGISHPCTAFDKWDVLYRIDEATNVTGALKTFF